MVAHVEQGGPGDRDVVEVASHVQQGVGGDRGLDVAVEVPGPQLLAGAAVDPADEAAGPAAVGEQRAAVAGQ